MKINGKEVVGNKFAYDGCHKIYIVEDLEDERKAKDLDYSIHHIEEIEDFWKLSCSLRFINNWKLNKMYVAQFEDATFEE